VPRVFTPSLRPLTAVTTLGFECIEFAEHSLDLELMPWQKWFLLHALELHPTELDEFGDPVFRFRKVILLVGRQNGKSTVMQALTLWRMFVDRCSLVIGTAQDLEVAETLWAESIDMAEETEELKDEIGKIERQPGRKMFRLRSGETYKVKAANRRAGRGLSGDLVLLDELREHQTWDSWGAVTKTTNAKARAQVYGISNAGDATSTVLRYLRKKAHAELGDPDGINADENLADLVPEEFEGDEEALDSGLAIFEWSAPPGCSILDRDGWAQANPALGYRVREATLASDAQTDPEWVFRTEVLCQWSDGSLEGPFPPGSWEAGVDPASVIPDDAAVMYCVDVAWDRSMSYIAVAGHRADGLPHVEIVAQRSGTEWVVSRHKRPDGSDEMRGWFADRATEANPMTVVLQAKGAPVSSMLDDLKAVPYLTVVEWAGSDLGAASGQFFDLVVRSKAPEGESVREGLCHRPQPVLDVAAGTAVTKPLGDSWVWNRKASPNDAAPLVAATGAVWGAMQHTEVPFVSAYESAGVGVI